MKSRWRAALLVTGLTVASLALMPANASAEGPVIQMGPCVQAGHNFNVPAGSEITLVNGWAMATQGNLVDFVNAATDTFTINGVVVRPPRSDIAVFPSADSGTGEDLWVVDWKVKTLAPSPGQTMVWTVTLSLSRQITDHELIELGLAPVGQPLKLQAGVLYGPPQAVCYVTGV